MKQDLYIGIDLGTSAMKLLLMDAEGTIVKIVTEEYPLEFPKEGWSQQNPEDWAKALYQGLPKLLSDVDAACVRGIGAGGQMHGLVILDAQDQVIEKTWYPVNASIRIPGSMPRAMHAQHFQ